MMTINTHCRMCGSAELEPFISLGDQPLANRFLSEQELGQPEPVFPLEVYWCAHCNLAQLVHIVDKDELYRDYIYFSSGMPKLSDHFSDYASDVMTRYLSPGDLVVEIASNDGVLLRTFQDQGYRVLGIEPALNIVETARSLGVATMADFFSSAVVAEVIRKEGQARAVLSNNVVAHINDVHELAEGVAALLADDGVWVFEAPHLLDMFENLSYDTIYHEHLSYLAVRPVQGWLGRHGLEVFDVEVQQVQGQSLRAFVGHVGAHPISPSVAHLTDYELKLGMHEMGSYRTLASRIQASKDELVRVLDRSRQAGKRLAAYGAPAKGNTLLNYCGIGNDTLEFAIEDLPTKQGKYTPGTRIPCVPRSYADDHVPDAYLLLAWNYEKVILEKENRYRQGGGCFIVPIGDEIRVI